MSCFMSFSLYYVSTVVSKVVSKYVIIISWLSCVERCTHTNVNEDTQVNHVEREGRCNLITFFSLQTILIVIIFFLRQLYFIYTFKAHFTKVKSEWLFHFLTKRRFSLWWWSWCDDDTTTTVLTKKGFFIYGVLPFN